MRSPDNSGPDSSGRRLRLGALGAMPMLMLMLMLMLIGCAVAPPPNPLPFNSGPNASAKAAVQRAAELIVVTIVNDPAPLAVRAGATSRGYDAASAYGVARSTRAVVAALAREYRLRSMSAWPIAVLGVHCVVFATPPDQSREQVIAALARDNRVALAQPLQTFATQSQPYNDPYLELQRGFAAISAAEAQQWSQGEGVRVALIDTGIDIAHPDLRGRVARTGNFIDDDPRTFASDRHGTGVAGVIAAVANNAEGIVGVAPAVEVLAFKACQQIRAGADMAVCNSFTLAQALSAAIEASVDLINISVAGPPDPLLDQLLRAAIERGAIIVGAIPPDGRLDGFPVSTRGALAVAAFETPVNDFRVIRAPGSDILTLTPGGGYDFASGTSLATAHVTGTVALLMARRRGLGAGEVLALLRDVPGSVNACQSLASLLSDGACSAGKDDEVAQIH